MQMSPERPGWNDMPRSLETQRSAARVRRDDPHQHRGDTAGADDPTPKPRAVRGDGSERGHREHQREPQRAASAALRTAGT
jgi:hypothetical protein